MNAEADGCGAAGGREPGPEERQGGREEQLLGGWSSRGACWSQDTKVWGCLRGIPECLKVERAWLRKGEAVAGGWMLGERRDEDGEDQAGGGGVSCGGCR